MPTRSATKALLSESFFFTIDDVRLSFLAIVGESSAQAYADAWHSRFRDAVVGGNVVALPESFGFPRLASPSAQRSASNDDTHFGSVFDETIFEGRYGRRLLRFTPATLTLIAAASPSARARFDRIGLRYAYRTIDDPIEWNQLVTFLRES
ncbi:hypothetical protein [Gemmatimonas sp.]|uniref:hypothetical protein n=1 Tax=Gemmatimonas sp. TaxID=1962908 RepID=UPI00286E1C8C|nr:hypothetical protein [Gemmatimonas sp.]